MDKNEREAQRRQEDRALNSALIWVGAAIVLEFLLVMVNRHYINFMLTEQAINIAVAIQAALKALRWISLAGFVVGIVWTVRNLVTGKRTGRCGALSVAALVVLICTHVILTFSSTGLHMLFWLVPALAAPGPGVLSVPAGVLLLRLDQWNGRAGSVVCPLCRRHELVCDPAGGADRAGGCCGGAAW